MYLEDPDLVEINTFSTKMPIQILYVLQYVIIHLFSKLLFSLNNQKELLWVNFVFCIRTHCFCSDIVEIITSLESFDTVFFYCTRILTYKYHMCPYVLAIWVPYGSFMGVPIWAFCKGPIWVLYGRAYMGTPIYIQHEVHKGLLSGIKTQHLQYFSILKTERPNKFKMENKVNLCTLIQLYAFVVYIF